jgi:hypothetical protein
VKLTDLNSHPLTVHTNSSAYVRIISKPSPFPIAGQRDMPGAFDTVAVNLLPVLGCNPSRKSEPGSGAPLPQAERQRGPMVVLNQQVQELLAAVGGCWLAVPKLSFANSRLSRTIPRLSSIALILGAKAGAI